MSQSIGGCGIPCLQHAAPKSGFEYADGPETGGPGMFLYFRPIEQVSLSLRVHDISRQAQTWGTELPVVRETDVFTTEPAQLIGVPSDSRFRVALRVYDFDGRDGKSVRLRIYQFTDQPFIADRPVDVPVLQAVVDILITTSEAALVPWLPGYAEITDLIGAFRSSPASSCCGWS